MEAQHYEGVSRGGVFLPDNPKAFALAYCLLEGKRTRVTVGLLRKKRSNAQNAYWWSVVVTLIAKAMGENDLERAHKALVGEIHFDIIQGQDGLILKIPKPTHNLNTAEFSDLVARAQQFASEFFGLYIPDPGQI